MIEFYSYSWPDQSSANTTDDLEISNTSQVFFYLDEVTGALNLVVIHDRPNDSSGGGVAFDFLGLPAGATLEVRDDPEGGLTPDSYDFAPPTAAMEWRWGTCCTDGVAVEVGAAFDITIVPTFYLGIDTWVARSLHPNGRMDLIELDMNEPLRLFRSGK